MTDLSREVEQKPKILYLDYERDSHTRFKEILGTEYDIKTVFNTTQALSTLSNIYERTDLFVIGDTSEYDNISEFLLYIKREIPHTICMSTTYSRSAQHWSNSTDFNGCQSHVPKPWCANYLKKEVDRCLDQASTQIPQYSVEISRDLAFEEACQRWIQSSNLEGKPLSEINLGLDILVTLYDRNIKCQSNRDISDFLDKKLNALNEIVPGFILPQRLDACSPKTIH